MPTSWRRTSRTPIYSLTSSWKRLGFLKRVELKLNFRRTGKFETARNIRKKAWNLSFQAFFLDCTPTLDAIAFFCNINSKKTRCRRECIHESFLEYRHWYNQQTLFVHWFEIMISLEAKTVKLNLVSHWSVKSSMINFFWGSESLYVCSFLFWT